MQADPARARQLGHLLDRVDEAVRVVAGAAHEGDRLVVDEVGHGRHVRDVPVGERRVPHLDVHPVRALVEGAVRRHRHHQVGPGDATLRARLLAIRVERGHQALRAAAGDDADARPVQEVGRHRDDLALELGGARVHVALQDVGVGVEVEDLAEEVVVGVVARVEAARDGALVAEGVLGVRHLGDLLEDRGAVDGLFRHSPVRLGRAPVRVEIAEDLLESGVAHLSPSWCRWRPARCALPGARMAGDGVRPDRPRAAGPSYHRCRGGPSGAWRRARGRAATSTSGARPRTSARSADA